MIDDNPTSAGETYLGDGLYASFDGWHIVLRAPREGGDHWVGLEPAVFRELMRYQEELLVKIRAFEMKQAQEKYEPFAAQDEKPEDT
jgi:hypothetical protein